MIHGLLMKKADCRAVTRRVSKGLLSFALADAAGHSRAVNHLGERILSKISRQGSSDSRIPVREDPPLSEKVSWR